MGHNGHHHHGHHHQEQQPQSYAGYGLSPPPSYYPPPPSPYSAIPMQPYGYSAPDPYGYAIQPSPYIAAGPLIPAPYPDPYHHAYNQRDQFDHAIADRHRHGGNEHVGEVGAVAAGAFAMYEAHEAKVDPAHGGRHKLEAEVAGAVALGSAGYAFHEHHQKKKDEYLVSSLGGEYSGSHHGEGHHQHQSKHEEHHHNKHHNFW